MHRMTKETRIDNAYFVNIFSIFRCFCTHHTGRQIEQEHHGWVGGSVGSVSEAVEKEGQQ